MNAQAQRKVKLKVLEKGTEQPVIAATVVYADNEALQNLQGSVTNVDGLAELKIPSKKTYYYKISYVGFVPATGKIEATETEKTVYLEEDHLGLNEVVVTGSRTARPIKMSPVTTQVLGGKQLVEAGYSNLQQALQQETPGLNIQKVGFGNEISMQGLDARHVLFLMDVDHFKQINDGHGHHTGDEVLVALAQRLKATCRPTDLVARWGGEEFLVACRNLTREQAGQVAARLRRAMAYTLETAHSARPVTVSLGLAPIPFFDAGVGASAASRWDYALRMADRALYAAKRHRDAWVGYWGAQLPDDATAEAVLEQPEAAPEIVSVMSSVPRMVAGASEIARARSLRALRAQG